MKVTGSAQPTEDLKVMVNPDGTTCTIAFIRNAAQISVPSPIEGEDPQTMWQWDQYEIRDYPYRNMLKTDIENNEEPWYLAARRADEIREGVDVYQLRADLDYMAITQSAMMGISLLSADASGSDAEAVELARKHYPIRWDKAKVGTLVAMQKITASDYQSITGEAYQTA